jgi:hypothetical protein
MAVGKAEQCCSLGCRFLFVAYITHCLHTHGYNCIVLWRYHSSFFVRCFSNRRVFPLPQSTKVYKVCSHNRMFGCFFLYADDLILYLSGALATASTEPGFPHGEGCPSGHCLLISEFPEVQSERHSENSRFYALISSIENSVPKTGNGSFGKQSSCPVVAF